MNVLKARTTVPSMLTVPILSSLSHVPARVVIQAMAMSPALVSSELCSRLSSVWLCSF